MLHLDHYVGLKAIFLGSCVLIFFFLAVMMVRTFVFWVVAFRRWLATFPRDVFLPASGFKARWQQCFYESVIESSGNVMEHGDTREGKWRGNWRMQLVASTLHTTSEHGVSSIRLQFKCAGTRWRTGGEVKGKLVNAVGSQYPSHYLGTWCIQHYYRWCAHLGCQ